MELCLGTVQFGMDYGISNQTKPSTEEAIKILDYATQNGIDTIDTANAYGTAEDVVGVFLDKSTISREKIFLVSKFGPNLLDGVDEDRYYDVMKANLEDSLSRLHTDYLDSYMLHSAKYVYNDAIMDTLVQLKKQGYVRHCGVSVYEPEEAKRCIHNENADFMQLPYSILDQRMKKQGVFNLAKQKGNTQIHSRSAFVQGLALMKENEVPIFLADAKPIVKKLEELCNKNGISRISLALNYVKQETTISHLVFGVDNLEQLKEHIEIFKEDLPKDLVNEIAKEFSEIRDDISMPSMWKRN